MSNRIISEKKSDYKNPQKTQMKFVPKSDLQNPKSRQTLSNSFRSTTITTTSDAASNRVGMRGNGETMVNKSPVRGNFLVYLPQDEAVAAGFGPEDGGLDPMESQRVVDLLNRELSRLLKLHPKDFWREVATDESLHFFLGCFLKFKNRWYDFPYRGAQGKVAGVIVDESELCRRVFMVLYRLSSNRDPGAKAADILSQKEHAALLQDKKLLDLPKLLDICAVYGHENEDLTRMLVMNAMKAQPYIHDEFPLLMSHFLSIFQTMYERCSSTLEVIISSGGQDQGSNRLRSDYLEVMDFMNDAVVSMNAFVNAYKHAAVFFLSPLEVSDSHEELLTVLGKLHDSLLPALQKGFHIISATMEDKNQEMSSNVFISLKMLSTRITEFGWNLLHFCYLSDEAFDSSYSLPAIKMFPANVDDPAVRADILIQAIRDLSGGYAFEVHSWGTFIQHIEKNHEIMSRIDLLRKTGWIAMDNEQFQFLAGIMTLPLNTNTPEQSSASFPVRGKGKQTDEDAAIMESKIIQIKELFPDYGKGFLLACLEAYNQDPEEVIQRILEGTLHEELQSLDISLENVPPSKSAPAISRTNKGKGKLVEPVVPPPDVEPAVTKIQSTNSSSSSFGRFIRKNTSESPDFEILNSKKEKELTKTAVFASQLDYEDEYDDSFDDLGLSVQDSGLDEPENLSDKINSEKGSDDSKWGSRKKPQYYVKDGKNYSYKVDGSVAVANYNEAKLVNTANSELIHGLGRGGNLPRGAVKILEESANKEQDDGEDNDEIGGRGSFRGRGRGRGRGRRGFHSGRGGGVPQDEGREGDEIGGRGPLRGRGRRGFYSGPGNRDTEGSGEQDDGRDGDGGTGDGGNMRGVGRRGRGRSNQFRRDRAMSKHLSGLPGHYNS